MLNSFADNSQAFPIAEGQENQSGSSHLHYRISVPDMREMVLTWKALHGKSLTYDDWLSLLDALYHGESLQEHMLGGMLLAQYPKYRRKLPLSQLDIWLGQLEGWKEVDYTCQSVFTAKDMLPRWDEWQPFLRILSQDEHISKRRASLVFLVKPVREVAETTFWKVAEENIERLQHESDKLITKAISWVLRESIKQQRAHVEAYLEKHEAKLPAIAVREVRKKLTTGKK